MLMTIDPKNYHNLLLHEQLGGQSGSCEAFLRACGRGDVKMIDIVLNAGVRVDTPGILGRQLSTYLYPLIP